MATPKTPPSFADAFKAYENPFAELFTKSNPFADWLGSMGGKVDPQAMMQANKERVEALTRANEAAVSAYQGQVQRQMELFDTIMKSARDSMSKLDASPTPDAAKNNMEVYWEAVDTATRLMQKLSEETSAATGKVFENISKEVESAMGRKGK